jgi:hypothetical protein
VDAESARARFIRFGGWSLDVEISAYVLGDPNAFLEIQEDLLLGTMDVIDKSGTSVALPVRAPTAAADRAPAPSGGRR